MCAHAKVGPACSTFGIDRTPNTCVNAVAVKTRASIVDSVETLRDTVAALGLTLLSCPPGHEHGADLVLVNPAGGQIALEVKRLSLASVDGLERRLSEWSNLPSTSNGVRVVVADRVTQGAREMLQRAGWGWLDLRGHLHLAGPGLFIDSDVPRLKRPSSRSEPLAGRVGVEVAALMLLDPDRPAAVRQLATQLGRAPSSVSHVVSGLRTVGLLDQERRPMVPDLFQALAARWDSAEAHVASVPSPGQGADSNALRLGLDNIEDEPGWALTESVAAAAYGAPISLRADSPSEFYVPDEATLRRAVHLLGAADDRASRAATVRVAPVPIVCSRRVDASDWSEQEWPLAQPLFVALDLVQDPGRGREVVDQWTPPEPWRRVW